MMNIQGAQTEENWASRLNPKMANSTTTAPTTTVTATNQGSVGSQPVCGSMPKGIRTAEAATVIMHPARTQYRIALSTLYNTITTGPAIFRRYQYNVNRVFTAIGVQINVQESTARRFPNNRPTITS